MSTLPHATADSYGGVRQDVRDDMVAHTGMDGSLLDELVLLDGIHAQNPETGAGLNPGGGPLLGNYTNRLFGCPYQLLDSVDKRFDKINRNIGSEYMKHFLLHSPILYIRPGMPKYTGGDEQNSVWNAVKQAYVTASSDGIDRGFGSSFLQSIAEKTLFKDGSRLQARMFGFKPTYNDYMMYVNYMCRVTADLLGVTNNVRFPNGVHTSRGFEAFDEIRWENYRMSGEQVQVNTEYLSDLFNASFLGDVAAKVGQTGSAIGGFFAGENAGDWGAMGNNMMNALGARGSESSMFDVMANRIESVLFMVEPVSFQESLSNQTGQSMVESAMDGAHSLGTEIAFITNSNVDTSILTDIAAGIGGTAMDAMQNLGGLVARAGGGFMVNLFDGAMNSLRGQKMIYPEIYKSSRSEMNYEFTVNLSSPYGDIYNYYMNIVVPLLHLIALAAPRMVTANSVASPFLVQAYIPGMCTCQLGIISQLSIVKNKNTKHVSVNGFPLTVTVSFTVKELYNAMAISPAHDPASFLFNETLNDYMANLAGLIPSMDTSARIRDVAWKNVGKYFKDEVWQDVASRPMEFFDGFFRPN